MSTLERLRAGLDRLYLAGPEIRVLADALPNDIHCEYEASADDLTGALVASPQPGDVIMVKGSNASRMGPLVENIKARFAPAMAAAQPKQEQEKA